MKKIALVLTGAFLSVATMGAMANIYDNVVIESKYDDKKTKVEKSELPQEVIQSLEESQYQNWEIQEAYKVKDELTNEVHYELHVANTDDAQMVKNVTFSKDGQIISEQDSDLGRTEDQEQQGTEPGIEETDPGMEETPDQGTEPSTQPETDQPGTETPVEQY